MAAAACVVAPSVSAQDSFVHDIDINIRLTSDGTALVREIWNVDINRGTEWYLVRSNLGDMRISGLRVTDETGSQYADDGFWNSDRSFGEKAFRCGIVEKEDGCEICWGLGSHGSHIYTVEYSMTNAVKAMLDYDKLHLQVVSPGVRPRPQHVKVTISSDRDSVRFADENTGIWAFGFNGTVNFAEGSIVLETSSPFESDAYSVISLCRFNKDVFTPTSIAEKDIPFQTSLDAAFEDSAYEDFLDAEERDRKTRNGVIAFFTAMIVFVAGLKASLNRKRNREMFGVLKLKEIGYERDLPFDGNLYETRYVLKKISAVSSDANMASALILKMIKNKYLTVDNDADGKILISFTPNADLGALCESEREFLSMLKASSGEDGVLQEKEFSRWSRRVANRELITRWITDIPSIGASFLAAHGYGAGTRFSPEGQKHARRVVGFRKYLKDFTIINERKSSEVALWQDYLIYAALYGIADKVARELRDINPQAFEEYVGYNYPTMSRVLLFSNSMGASITGAVAAQQTKSSVGGHGGFSSFGGGGGFSGGGFGGGAR